MEKAEDCTCDVTVEAVHLDFSCLDRLRRLRQVLHIDLVPDRYIETSIDADSADNGPKGRPGRME